jgi:hypothetical protein
MAACLLKSMLTPGGLACRPRAGVLAAGAGAACPRGRAACGVRGARGRWRAAPRRARRAAASVPGGRWAGRISALGEQARTFPSPAHGMMSRVHSGRQVCSTVDAAVALLWLLLLLLLQIRTQPHLGCCLAAATAVHVAPANLRHAKLSFAADHIVHPGVQPGRFL